MNKAPTDIPLFQGQPERINTPAWAQYFQQVFDFYQNVQRWVDPYHAEFGKVEPSHILGLVGFANGVNWNPSGTGTVGYFWWNGAGWTQL